MITIINHSLILQDNEDGGVEMTTDEYRFLVHPVVMGCGKHFFEDGMHTTRLKLVKTKTLDLGVILLSYEPARS